MLTHSEVRGFSVAESGFYCAVFVRGRSSSKFFNFSNLLFILCKFIIMFGIRRLQMRNFCVCLQVYFCYVQLTAV